jgi:hydroxyacylglutathione hydrolase
MEIITVETPSLGDRSHLVVEGAFAAAIDPQRDVDRLLGVLEERSLHLTHVFETHIHNDYVTGGLELARRTGAAYVLSAADDVRFDRVAAQDGDEFAVGALVVRAVSTPGHTPNHLSYVVSSGSRPLAVFTGGSMLFGTVGRTDLIAPEATDGLTRDQYRSVRRLAGELPADVSVHPTHGFGSFCASAPPSGAESSTIAHERAVNLALTVDDEQRFVERLLGGLSAHPRYYAHMAPLNRRGPTPVDLSPPEPVDPGELRRRIAAGEWIVDVRSRSSFARAHLAGTIGVPGGDSFVTYLGWLLPWGTPVTLVGDTAEDVAEAQRQMARIGIDRPAGAATGGLERWGAGGEIRSFRSATFADLADARERGDVTVVDVRRDDEWADGHVAGALHVPLHELEERIGEVPADEVVWVHCATGYRASVAASLLDRAGRRVVAVDEEWEAASKHEALGVTSA